MSWVVLLYCSVVFVCCGLHASRGQTWAGQTFHCSQSSGIQWYLILPPPPPSQENIPLTYTKNKNWHIATNFSECVLLSVRVDHSNCNDLVTFVSAPSSGKLGAALEKLNRIVILSNTFQAVWGAVVLWCLKCYCIKQSSIPKTAHRDIQNV